MEIDTSRPEAEGGEMNSQFHIGTAMTRLRIVRAEGGKNEKRMVGRIYDRLNYWRKRRRTPIELAMARKEVMEK
jgi:hypothetical protein